MQPFFVCRLSRSHGDYFGLRVRRAALSNSRTFRSDPWFVCDFV
jgi:hypothetical protein